MKNNFGLEVFGSDWVFTRRLPAESNNQFEPRIQSNIANTYEEITTAVSRPFWRFQPFRREAADAKALYAKDCAKCTEKMEKAKPRWAKSLSQGLHGCEGSSRAEGWTRPSKP